MGKKSRRANRRNRPRRGYFAANAGELSMVVVTAPRIGDDGAVSLRREIDLVRAGLLYADRIELISPAAAMLGGIVAASDLGATAWTELMLACSDAQWRAFGIQGDIAAMRRNLELFVQLSSPNRADRRKTHGSQAADALRRLSDEVQEALEAGQNGLPATVDRMVASAGGLELQEAIDAGIVHIAEGHFELGGSTDDQVEAFTKMLARRMEAPRNYLLLDESLLGLTRAMVNEGIVTPHASTVAHARRAATGSGLIARLPAFQGAHMADVLQVRADVRTPLANFRRAVNRFALDSAGDPFAEAFGAEVDDLWATDVAPLLDELREALAVSSLINDMAKRFSLQPTAFVMAEGLAALNLGLGIPIEDLTASGLAAAAVAAAAEALGARAQARHADLYYLLEVDRRLA